VALPASGLSAMVLVGVGSLAGCSGGSGSATSASGSTPSGVEADAVNAYVSYVQAADNAERHPPRLGDLIDPAADYTRYSFNPVRGQEAEFISYLVTNHQALRGTAPVPHPAVVSVRRRGEPYLTVTLTDCLHTPADWQRYDLRTGATVPDPNATVTTQRTKIEVVYLQGRWGVRTIDPVPGRPCPG
jgi:hypothetical protein